MKAAVYHKYGPPESVRVEEVPTPTAKAGDVLIRIRATTISTADWRGAWPLVCSPRAARCLA